MNTLVLIGLLLVAAGLALLVLRFASRVRRQFSAQPARPRTVADLVRLRQETAAGAAAQPAQPAAAAPVPSPPVADRPAPAPELPAQRVAPSPTPEPVPAPARPGPAFVAPPPRPTPVAGRVRREPAEPPTLPLGGDNSPWQRGARMAVGLGGGQPWREPPAPPAPLRIVPAAEPEAPVAAAAPETPAGPADAAVSTPVRLVPTEPEPAPAQPAPFADAGEEQSEQGSVRLVPDEPEPAEAARPAPVVNRDAVWIEPGAAVAAEPAPREADAAEPAGDELVAPDGGADPVSAPAPERGDQAAAVPADEPAEDRPAKEPAESPVPDRWDDAEAEDVPAAAVPDRFAEEQPVAPAEPTALRRSRQTPDERAAEQAAADLALLRTFGFTDSGQRPDSAPVVAMEHADEPEARVDAGAAQPVRYRVVRRDGSVVGGATVTLLDDRGGDVAAGAADDEGRGEVLAPAPGGYVLVSTAAGHQPGAVAVTVADSATETDVLIARSASVSGNVRGEDGSIAGARVTLVQDGEALDTVDTDAGGAYRISDIGAGEYGLSVAAPGCEPAASLLEVAEEAEVHHDVELRPATPVADSDRADDAMSGLR